MWVLHYDVQQSIKQEQNIAMEKHRARNYLDKQLFLFFSLYMLPDLSIPSIFYFYIIRKY